MEHRRHALVVRGVGDAPQNSDGGTTAALPEDDPGSSGDEVGKGLLLPLAAVLRRPKRPHAGSRV